MPDNLRDLERPPPPESDDDLPISKLKDKPPIQFPEDDAYGVFDDLNLR